MYAEGGNATCLTSASLERKLGKARKLAKNQIAGEALNLLVLVASLCAAVCNAPMVSPGIFVLNACLAAFKPSTQNPAIFFVPARVVNSDHWPVFNAEHNK